MQIDKTLLLTAAGWKALNDELNTLVAGRLNAAFSKSRGLLHADPDDVPNRLAVIDKRIEELQQILRFAVPVKQEDLVDGTVGVGSCVSVVWQEGDKEELTIVGPPEVSTREGRISYESPVGRALIGRQSGDNIAVPFDSGFAQLTVVAVNPGPRDS